MIKVTESTEQSYLVDVPVETDIDFDTSYDGDIDYEENFEDEIRSLTEDICMIIFDMINDDISGISKSLGSEVTNVELTDAYDDEMIRFSITLSKPVDTDKIAKELSSICDKSYTDSSTVNFYGDILGYEHGDNLPVQGGPPIYSDETGRLEISVYTVPGNLVVELDD